MADRKPMIQLQPGKLLGVRVPVPASHRAFERLLRPIDVDESRGKVLCEWEMLPSREGETHTAEWFDKSSLQLVFDVQGK